MAVIEKRDNDPLKSDASMNFPAMMIPGFRTIYAQEKGTLKNMLIHTEGGLGDQICCEPVIRHAINRFRDTDITIVTDFPELFKHLKVKEILHARTDKPDLEKYFYFQSLQHDGLSTEFLCNLFTNIVDYASLMLFRSQLPVKDRCLKFAPPPEDYAFAIKEINATTDVVIHPGRGWQSKTFPKTWWDTVIQHIVGKGFRPVLIGKASDQRGTVDVDTTGCLDLREKLTLNQSIAVLHVAKVLLTNDSAPLHLAASGEAWIGFLATSKQSDFIMHFRNGGEWGWRMKDHSKGNMYDLLNLAPNHFEKVQIADVSQEILNTWLPDPKEFAEWGIEKICLTT